MTFLLIKNLTVFNIYCFEEEEEERPFVPSFSTSIMLQV